MKRYKFKRRFEEKGNWILSKDNFEEKINELKLKYDKLFETNNDVFIVIKQWFYKMATAPNIHLCFDCEDFEYLLKKDGFFAAGDILQVFLVSDVNLILDLVIPDENNLIPEKGSY